MLHTSDTESLQPHNKALNRYRFSGEIKLLQGLHIGSGRGDDRTDALVIRDAQGKPIIPGSSLRGVLRSSIERVLMGLYKVGATSLWACQLYEPDLPDGKFCVGNSVHKASVEKSREFQKLQEKENGTARVWEQLPVALCDSCKLFGAGTFYASKIRFTDLDMVTGKSEPVIRHGVGIHRDTGTAAGGVKYDKEVVEAGATFRFEAVGENLVENDLALLALGFSALLDGELALGGSTGRGLGGIQLIDSKVFWVNLDKKEEAKTFLLQKKYPHSLGLKQFTEEHLKKLLEPVHPEA